MNEFDEKNRELDPDEIAADVSFDDDVPNETASDAEVNDTVEEAVSEAEETAAEAAEVAETAETAEIAEEAAVSEEPEAAGAAEEASEEEIAVPVDEYKTILEAHFQNLRALIKYTKTKDETIQKLSGELQKYREDYCAKAFKSIAALLISFREDCRKSLADIGSFELTVEKARKYLSFLADDLEELLSNAGCEEDDGEWKYNGKPLTVTAPAAVTFPPLFAAEEAIDDGGEIAGGNIREYLISAETQIKRILADNERLDKCLKDYCTLASVIENDVVLLCVYPPIRKMISLYKKTKEKVEMYLSELSEDNKVDAYRDVLTFLIDQIEDILLSGGVKVDTTVDDTFDTRKNRLVRAVVTADPALDRKIAKQHTECYTMNDVVLYPAKVDVYKYQV